MRSGGTTVLRSVKQHATVPEAQQVRGIRGEKRLSGLFPAVVHGWRRVKY